MGSSARDHVSSTATEWIAWPEMVEVVLTDASGKDWRFVDKFFMFDDAGVLGPDVIFPAEIGMPCTIIDTYERNGRLVAKISTARWSLETVDGVAEFEVEARKLRRGG